MTEKQLFRAIGSVEDDLVEAAEAAEARPQLRMAVMKWGALAACAALIVGLGIFRLTATPQLVPQPSMEAEPRITPFSAPAGMRKIFNYGGYRYAFLEDGAPYDLSRFRLTEPLGTLEHDILAGMDGTGENQAAEMDFAATFALGGTLYALPGYDPAFRLAVVLDGESYVAELVGRVDNRALGADYYFGVSSMESLVKEARILPHMGGDPLYRLDSRKDARDIVRILSAAKPAELESEDYQAIASAQMEGRSRQLELLLADGTGITLYVTTEPGYVSIGDDYYILPDAFPVKYGDLFEVHEQGAPPTY